MENISTIDLHQFKDRSRSYNAWINVGYDLFAQEGPEGIQIERLARILSLNKSGFYHYFGTLDTYFEQLMQFHLHNFDMVILKIQEAKNFLPECVQLLSEFSQPILFQMQLQRANHKRLFAQTFEEVNHKVDPSILPLWADFIETSDFQLAARYFEFYRDIFYARLRPGALNFKFICDISIEAKDICKEFKSMNLYPREAITRQLA